MLEGIRHIIEARWFELRNTGYIIEDYENEDIDFNCKVAKNNALEEIKRIMKIHKKKGAYVGCYDKIGNFDVDYSGDFPEDIDEYLVNLAKDIGGIGSTGLTSNPTNDPAKHENIVGKCAEFRLVNKMLKKGYSMGEFMLTKAYRFRKEGLLLVPYCPNCKYMFKDILDKED